MAGVGRLLRKGTIAQTTREWNSVSSAQQNNLKVKFGLFAEWNPAFSEVPERFS
jgi:hypothetical protein